MGELKVTQVTVFLLLVALAITALLFHHQEPPEPSYNGITLTQSIYERQSGISPDVYNGGVAFYHIGTNAIPTLLRWSVARPNKFTLIAETFVHRHGWFTSWSPSRDAERLKDIGLRGFLYLGRMAGGVAPELLEIYKKTGDTDLGLAFMEISYTNDAVLPELAKLLNSKNPHDRRFVMECMLNRQRMLHGTNLPANVVPIVRKCLHDSEPEVYQAACAWVALSDSPVFSLIPDVERLLQKPDCSPMDLLAIARALDSMAKPGGLAKYQAEITMPTLTLLLFDGDGRFDTNVLNSIRSNELATSYAVWWLQSTSKNTSNQSIRLAAQSALAKIQGTNSTPQSNP